MTWDDLRLRLRALFLRRTAERELDDELRFHLDMEARKSCDQNRAFYGMQPATISRFETSDLSRLPNELAHMTASGRYRRAAVGACEVPTVTPFARFRLAVILYQ